MSARRANSYWKAMTAIQAEEAKLASRIVSHPHTKTQEQRKWLDTLSDSQRKYTVESRPTSMKEFVEAIRGGSIPGRT